LLATAFSSKDDLVLAASNDNATRIYDTRTQRLKHSLTGHIAKVCTAQFASEGQKVACGEGGAGAP
jgi:autophagy-related protein 16